MVEPLIGAHEEITRGDYYERYNQLAKAFAGRKYAELKVKEHNEVGKFLVGVGIGIGIGAMFAAAGAFATQSSIAYAGVIGIGASIEIIGGLLFLAVSKSSKRMVLKEKLTPDEVERILNKPNSVELQSFPVRRSAV